MAAEQDQVYTQQANCCYSSRTGAIRNAALPMAVTAFGDGSHCLPVMSNHSKTIAYNYPVNM